MPNLTLINDYFTLCKPRVVLLMLVTAWVGMYLANSDLPSSEHQSWFMYIYASIGIAFSAGAAAIINHVVDKHVDTKMSRTATRPIASGRIQPSQAIVLAVILTFASWLILYYWVNPLTALLTLATLIGYAIVYTMYLKRATPQNIVIGGVSGAMPPLLGWSAISGNINSDSLLLVLIIFVWTPPHFWALAIYRVQDYSTAKIPMLPVTHGVAYTKLSLLLYTVLLFATTLLPYVVGMGNNLYLTSALILNTIFLYLAIRLYFSTEENQKPIAIKTFKFSQVYLLLLFMSLLIERCYRI